MPGYILHLTEAKLICDKLRREGVDISQEWENEFKIGSILPDTRLRPDKKYSHFWDKESMKKLAIAPDIDRFLAKYSDKLDSALMLGYWCHLQLDYLYVSGFWKEVLEFRGAEGEIEELRDKITTVVVKRTGREIPEEEFFSVKYYYGDYSRTNDWLINKYGIKMPVYKEMPCPVEEVSLPEVRQIIELLLKLHSPEREGGEKHLKVFTLEGFCRFIESSAAQAADMVLPRLRNC